MDYEAMLEYLYEVRDNAADIVEWKQTEDTADTFGNTQFWIDRCKTINSIIDLVRNHRDGR